MLIVCQLTPASIVTTEVIVALVNCLPMTKFEESRPSLSKC